jgi:hypothetical protein
MGIIEIEGLEWHGIRIIIAMQEVEGATRETEACWCCEVGLWKRLALQVRAGIVVRLGAAVGSMINPDGAENDCQQEQDIREGNKLTAHYR